tara:strand:- start:1089 stop:1766 length:678 start_codon:yes stop_codon:yes gene_type:complete
MIDYIPILTTILSLYFFIEILKHYLFRKKKYLFWWMIGVATFGLGTLSESIHTIIGYNEFNLRFWYILGALLGGFPLAQGTVYLLFSKKFANQSSLFFISYILVASIFILMVPIKITESFDGGLTGQVFGWQWVRIFSIPINIYAFTFLVGGAIYSAYKYSKFKNLIYKVYGNTAIAIGGILPGIGGSFTRAGYVEVLFVTEFFGLASIYAGYKIIKYNTTIQVS